jgi:hypothetical protein
MKVKGMTRAEMRSWRKKEKERLSALVDEDEKKYCQYTIYVLDEVLGEGD